MDKTTLKALYAPFEGRNSKVRFTGLDGATCYGLVGYPMEHDKEVVRLAEKGLVLVEDAVLSKTYGMKPEALSILPIDLNGYDSAEYDAHVKAAFDKAMTESEAAKGLTGKVFYTSVGDGTAYYVVTGESKARVKVEWRGFHNPDRYVDGVLGWSGSFPRANIARLVGWAEEMKRISALWA